MPGCARSHVRHFTHCPLVWELGAMGLSLGFLSFLQPMRYIDT